MEITGKIIKVLELRGGTSQRTGNAWKSQEYVIETSENYPRKCVFRVFGEDKINNFGIKEGENLTVSIDIDAHEYNGRWFNDISAWKVDRQQAAAPAAPSATAPGNDELPSDFGGGVTPPASGAAPASGDDDLPF